MKRPKSGGGWKAIGYTLTLAKPRRLVADVEGASLEERLQDMRGRHGRATWRNGQRRGHFPEVCKKSVQAMASDMQGAIRPDSSSRWTFPASAPFTARPGALRPTRRTHAA